MFTTATVTKKGKTHRRIFDARGKSIFAEDTQTKRKYISLDKKQQLSLRRKNK